MRAPPSPTRLCGYRSDGLLFEQLIGGGGMGDVFLGRQLHLDRRVAIKVIRTQYAQDHQMRDRFLREAKAMGRIKHPHIVACYDAGPVRGPDHEELIALVLEYVDGYNLAKLAACEDTRVHDVVTWMRQVATGLAAAHAQGILHRDIKPENILVGSDGLAKLTDFGLARVPQTLGITTPGAIVGTAEYMAPETCERGVVAMSGDIYGLGCTMYCALTGLPPYQGRNVAQVMEKHIHEPPPLLSTFRTDLRCLDDVVQRSLAKDPARRFASSEEFERALRTAAHHLPADARTARAVKPGANQADSSSGQRPSVSASKGLVVLIVILLISNISLGVLAIVEARRGHATTNQDAATRPAMEAERNALRRRLNELDEALSIPDPTLRPNGVETKDSKFGSSGKSVGR